MARASHLEDLLRHEQRTHILEVGSHAAKLRPHLESQTPLCLLLDSALEDASALDFLIQALLLRPISVLTFDGTPNAEFAFESIRAGAVTALPWPENPPPGFATRLSTFVEAAWRTPAHALRHTPMRLRKVASRSAGETPTRSVVLVCGTRAAAALCALAHNLPSDTQAAIVAVDALERPLAKPFARQLARYSELQITTHAQAALRRAHIYLFDDSVTLTSDARGKYPIPRRAAPSRSARPAGGTRVWLDALAERLEREQLHQVVIIVNGYIDLSTTELIGHAVSHGAVLAESTVGGFQVRWRHTQPFERLSTQAFWNHLQERLSAPN